MTSCVDRDLVDNGAHKQCFYVKWLYKGMALLIVAITKHECVRTAQTIPEPQPLSPMPVAEEHYTSHEPFP